MSSKTHVAPNKGQTVPWLELLGAGIIATLMHPICHLLMSECFIGRTCTLLCAG